MSTATIHRTTAPTPLEVPGPVTRLPSLDEIERLTAVADRRVVYRGVDYAFYERLVDSIPESSNIHVDYDGKDLEVISKSSEHELTKRLIGKIVDIVAEEYEIPFAGYAEMTWKRPELSRGLEADESFYFVAEKIEAAGQASARGSRNVDDFPNPDLALEVDVSPPEVDRAGIYAALRVAELWRFAGRKLIIERLTSEGTYAVVDRSGFLPVSPIDIERWLVDPDTKYQSAWLRKVRAEIKQTLMNRPANELNTDN